MTDISAIYRAYGVNSTFCEARTGHEVHVNVQLTGGGVTMHGGFVESQSRALGTCKCTCISRE